MLALTADIAEELLLVKDAGSDTLPDGLKLKIISLAELAATIDAPGPAAEDSPEETDEVLQGASPEVLAEIAEGAQAMEAEETMEAEAISDAEHSSESAPALREDETETALQEEKEESAPVDDPVVEEVIEDKGDVIEDEPADASEPVRRLDPKALFQAFSINDAFLFRREIFGGSKQRFSESLDHIATLPDSQALREYLGGELGLDLDQYPGKEFYQSLVVFF